MFNEWFDETEKELNEKVLKADPENKNLKKLGHFSKYLTINTMKKVIDDEDSEDVKNYAMILVLGTYLIHKPACDDIFLLYTFCQKIEQVYEIVDDLTNTFYDYLIERLTNQKLVPDKLSIIRFINRYEVSQLNMYKEGGIQILEEFYSKYFNNQSFLENNEYYEKKLVGVLILETYLSQGPNYYYKIEEFYQYLKLAIFSCAFSNPLVYNSVFHYINFFKTFFNRAVRNNDIRNAIKNDFQDLVTMFYLKHSKMKLENSLPELVGNLNCSFSIDESDICSISKLWIYSNDENKNFTIKVKAAKYQDYAIVLKHYILKENYQSIKLISSENRVLEMVEKIRQKSPDQFCFLQYFGMTKEDNLIKLIQKHGGTSLNTLLQNGKFQADERELFNYFKSLIVSFYELKKNGIIHCDIKSRNILIDINIKKAYIIDFNSSTIWRINDDENSIRGTKTHASPEISVFFENLKEVRTFYYDSEKADVFSLGLVFLEMIYKENLVRLNSFSESNKLHEKLNNVPFEWAKYLIRPMISVDPWERPNFEELCNTINQFS